MRLIGTTTLVGLLTSVACYAAAQELQTASQDYRACNCSDFLFAERVSLGHSGTEIQSSRAAVGSVTLEQVKSELENYTTKRAEVEASISRFKASEIGYKVGSATASSGAPDTAVNLINLGYEIATDRAIQARQAELASARQDLAKGIVAGLLKNNKEALTAARSGDGNQAYDLIFGNASAAEILAIAGVDASLDDGARTEMIGALGQINADNIGYLAEMVDALSSGQAGALEKLQTLRSGILKFETGVTAEVQNISAALSGLEAAYDTIIASDKSDAFRLKRVEEIMFGNLSPGEKFEALQRGEFKVILSGMNEDKRKAFEEGIEKSRNIETWKGQANDFIGGASGILNIARNAGIDVGGAQETVDKAQSIFTGVLSIYAGGPIGIIGGISAISNVFGGGGSNQNAAVLDAIRKLSEQVKEYHEAEMEKLAQIDVKIERGFARSEFLQTETLILLQQVSMDIKEILGQGISSCNKLKTSQSQLPLSQVSSAIFYMNDFNVCRIALRELFDVGAGGDSYKLSGLFKENSITVGPITSTPFYLARAEVISPMLDYSRNLLKRRYPGCGSDVIDSILARELATDPRHEGEARRQLPSTQDGCPEVEPLRVEPSGNRRFSLSEINDPIDFEEVSKILGYAAAIYPLYERMENPGSDPLILKDFVDQTSLSGIGLDDAGRSRIEYTRGELALAYASGLISIMQINLLAGDLLMEQLETDLLAGLQADPATMTLGGKIKDVWVDCAGNDTVQQRYFAAICALERNDILKANFGRYMIRRHLAAGKRTAIARYQIAHGRYKNGQAAIGEILATLDAALPIKDGGATPRNAAFVFPLFKQAKFENPGTVAAGNYKGMFSLTGDLVVPLPDWHEVATDRQVLGVPGGIAVVQATQRISEMIESYDMSLAVQPELRGLAQEAAVAVAERR